MMVIGNCDLSHLTLIINMDASGCGVAIGKQWLDR